MTAYAEGVPCGADAFVPDVRVANRFYGELFGWTFRSDEVDADAFTIALNDSKPIAALLPKADSRMPTAWSVSGTLKDPGLSRDPEGWKP